MVGWRFGQAPHQDSSRSRALAPGVLLVNLPIYILKSFIRHGDTVVNGRST